VFRFLILILLVSALIVPRAAWGAHLSGHDDLSAAGAVHSHHGDDSHDHDSNQLSADASSVTGDGEQDGLTHDHSPSFAVSGAIMLPCDAVLHALSVVVASTENMERSGTSLSHPDSLLRPPRAT
jgi:hypothetical protein